MAQPTTIKDGDPRNDVTPSAPRGFSTFDLSHRFLQTHRFGEITPHESFETVKGAKDSVRLMCDTSSYSLKAPLKTEMFQKRCNFFVPLQAIIRNNWELITAQPSQGDDVDDDVDGVVSASVLNEFFNNLIAAITEVTREGDTSVTLDTYLSNLLRNMLIAEMFFSQGSLSKQLYYDFSHCVRARYMQDDSEPKTVTFDRFLERVLSAFAPRISDGSVSGINSFSLLFYDEDGVTTDRFYVVPDSELSDNPALVIPGSGFFQQINFRHALDLMRQNLNFKCFNFEYSGIDMGLVYSGGTVSVDAGLTGYIFGEYNDGGEITLSFVAPVVEDINFDKLSAYQICCAHFFSLDHVDYIYSAELYRQLMQFYTEKIFSAETISQYFAWNGLKLQYDALSGYVMANTVFNLVFPSLASHPRFSYHWCYTTALFSFRHSLRYLDYFTGGRTQPLSVGSNTDPRANINVAVNNNAVNGVEMILAQNAARYLNFAQRTGRKISQWLEKMFPGGAPKPDYHDPQWLSATGDALNPEQVQNTGESQSKDANSITARFKADSNKYMFTIHPDRPGYIICVTYYDIPRAYAFATHRENLHCNRYDRFNPFLQYNGSQKVSRQELGLSGDAPFSYQGRYEEYKQNYDVCAGGFVENLPGFAFIADVQSGLPMQLQLNPTYVRSWNTELDPFYLALTGYGLAAYFHFIVKNVNIINAVRPMEYAPQLM